MTAKRDYYEVLGIDRNSDAAAIKKAYRKLAKKYHPDTNPGNAEAEKRFKEVTEAYNVLSDDEKKKLYDQFGHRAFEEGFQPGGGYGGDRGAYREFHFEGGSMDDIFENLFGDAFHGRSGFHGFERETRGRDLETETEITLQEAALGCEKRIHIRREDGQVQSLQVKIPAGIEDGKSIRLRGKGAPGWENGQPGDLFLRVRVRNRPGFERKGMDLYTTAQIPFTTAVFGGDVRVGTLYGDVMCNVRPGTQSGTKIRLRGKGVVSMKNPSVRGDQYVTVQIQVPTGLNPTARQKLKEFEAACRMQYKAGDGSR